jgi:hypothetical protein
MDYNEHLWIIMNICGQNVPRDRRLPTNVPWQRKLHDGNEMTASRLEGLVW